MRRSPALLVFVCLLAGGLTSSLDGRSRFLFGLRFGNATTDRVTAAANTAIDGQDPWTVIVAWRMGTLTNGAFIQKGLFGSNSRRVALGVNAAAARVNITIDRATADLTYSADNVLASNTYQFIAATFNSANGANDLVRLYQSVNGGALTRVTWTSTSDGSGALQPDTSQPIACGNSSNGAGPTVGGDGFLCVFAGAELDFNEINAVRENPFAPIRRVLVWWYLGENGSGPVQDWSGWTNVGTLTGAVTSAERWPFIE